MKGDRYQDRIDRLESEVDVEYCKSIVERRSGYGWTSGAGDRAGAHTALCGKPVVDDSSFCRRHLNLNKRTQVLLAAKRERDLAGLDDNGSRSTK